MMWTLSCSKSGDVIQINKGQTHIETSNKHKSIFVLTALRLELCWAVTANRTTLSHTIHQQHPLVFQSQSQYLSSIPEPRPRHGTSPTAPRPRILRRPGDPEAWIRMIWNGLEWHESDLNMHELSNGKKKTMNIPIYSKFGR